VLLVDILLGLLLGLAGCPAGLDKRLLVKEGVVGVFL